MSEQVKIEAKFYFIVDRDEWIKEYGLDPAITKADLYKDIIQALPAADLKELAQSVGLFGPTPEIQALRVRVGVGNAAQVDEVS